MESRLSKLISGLLCFLITGVSGAFAGQPNFVVIFTDDQGYADLGAFGGEHVSTPHIDRMVAEGMKLTNFYVAAPACSPSRAALMTGSYPRRIDMATGSSYAVLLPGDRKGLHPDEVTIAEILKKAGYRTGIFGKWHLGDQLPFLPTRQGFDMFFGIPYSHDMHPSNPNHRFHFPPLPLLNGENVIEMDPDADLLTRRITQRAVEFIKENRRNPFFLYIPHPMPHRPLHVSLPFMTDVQTSIKDALGQAGGSIDYSTRDKLFRQTVSEIDWSVYKILTALKEEGLDENTLVLFTSDNGPAVGSMGSAEPLTGRKGSTFEGGMRVPAVIRWPGYLPAGSVNNELMTTMDILPTFAELAGIEVATDRTIDGKDIWPALTGISKSPHKAFFYYKENDLEAVRAGPWKLRIKDDKPVALFNLKNDIGEKNNVLTDNRSITKQLLSHITLFQRELRLNSRPAGFVNKPELLSIVD